MTQRIPLVMTAVASAAAFGSLALRAAPRTYSVDPAKSHVTIHVGKTGAFSFAGHTHVVNGPIESGTIDVDPDSPEQSQVRLVIAASALKVSPQGEPAGDVPKVQQAMEGDQVLDVAHHPQITYESTAVTLKSRRGELLDLLVAGRLTVRGVAQPLTAPIRVELSDDALKANGRFTIKQTAFGIKPISVGGAVSVKDALDIDFAVVAAK